VEKQTVQITNLLPFRFLRTNKYKLRLSGHPRLLIRYNCNQ
jgi:hypothetical protein